MTLRLANKVATLVPSGERVGVDDGVGLWFEWRLVVRVDFEPDPEVLSSLRGSPAFGEGVEEGDAASGDRVGAGQERVGLEAGTPVPDLDAEPARAGADSEFDQVGVVELGVADAVGDQFARKKLGAKAELTLSPLADLVDDSTGSSRRSRRWCKPEDLLVARLVHGVPLSAAIDRGLAVLPVKRPHPDFGHGPPESATIPSCVGNSA
jgi:hypothetical protein